MRPAPLEGLEPTLNQRRLSIIGPGRAGTAIAKALANKGWLISRVAGRSIEHAQPLAEKLGALACSAADVGIGVDLIIISTPDAAISETALIVAARAEHGALLIHLAGATGIEALEGVRSTRPDLVLGSLHPLQTLSDDNAFEKLQAAFCAVEGPQEIEELAREIGLTPFYVLPANRSAYHAAAVVASNHLVALMGQVERMASSAGVPFEAFAPLARAALEAALIGGPQSALTGPVSRGDTATIEAHLRDIDPSELAVYKALARDALRLSGRDDAALEEMLS
jgi:predicted short-subunit dehydrogenase-like oxidoreductase (DUF2520 family)